MKPEELLERIIFVSGPPRSGTTFAVKSLNHHPAFIAAIDDHVYECWGLYYYRQRCGLVHEMRIRSVKKAETEEILGRHLFHDDHLISAAPSEKTKNFTEVPESLSRYPGSIRSVLDRDVIRYSVPLTHFSAEWRICLKSPEISFVLPQLADVFPQAKFVLVYRPIIEIAESMYRTGNMVIRFPVYHRRWVEEKKESGELMPPPGIPEEWNTLWQKATDFQRCVMYASSYVRAILQGVARIKSDRYFIYNHKDLLKDPASIFGPMAEFLAVDISGFKKAKEMLKADDNWISAQLISQYSEIDQDLSADSLMHQMESLRSSHS